MPTQYEYLLIQIDAITAELAKTIDELTRAQLQAALIRAERQMDGMSVEDAGKPLSLEVLP